MSFNPEQPPISSLEDTQPIHIAQKPSSVKTSHPIKFTATQAKKFIISAFPGIILFLLFFGMCLAVYLLIGSDETVNSDKSDNSPTFNESDALQAVQGWKTSSNKGYTCKEIFVGMEYFYRNNLGISDATVKWSVTKQSDTLFIVHADLKGETGWANFSWQVKFPEQRITALGEINLCKP